MKITFSNTNLNTEISISDNNLASGGEILIECRTEDQETWHTFTSLKEFEDFYQTVETMRDRLRNHLKG